MRIPKRELRHYLGSEYKYMSFSKMIRLLKKRGLYVDGKMTLYEVFEEVRKWYKDDPRNCCK